MNTLVGYICDLIRLSVGEATCISPLKKATLSTLQATEYLGT